MGRYRMSLSYSDDPTPKGWRFVVSELTKLTAVTGMLGVVIVWAGLLWLPRRLRRRREAKA